MESTMTFRNAGEASVVGSDSGSPDDAAGGNADDDPHRAVLRVVRPANPVNMIAAEQAASAFLVALGVSLDTESLAATPGRMARAYAEMFSPRPFDLTTFPNDAGYDELILAR